MDIQLIGLIMLFLVAAGEVIGFAVMIKMMRDVAAIQRAIFLFMRQRFGDLEELLKA